MRKALEIYALATCLIAVLIITVSVALSIYSGVCVLLPAPTLPRWDLAVSASDHDLARDWPKDKAPPTERDIAVLRANRLEQSASIHRRGKAQELVQQLIFAATASVLFLIHWRLAKRVRKAEEGAQPRGGG
jgi:hypothetical protein